MILKNFRLFVHFLDHFDNFGLLFDKPMLPLFLRLPETNILDPNRPYISPSLTTIRNVCLSIVLEFCNRRCCYLLLWSVVRLQPTLAYEEA